MGKKTWKILQQVIRTICTIEIIIFAQVDTIVGHFSLYTFNIFSQSLHIFFIIYEIVYNTSTFFTLKMYLHFCLCRFYAPIYLMLLYPHFKWLEKLSLEIIKKMKMEKKSRLQRKKNITFQSKFGCWMPFGQFR